MPIRQEQLKNRPGDRFHELGVPLLMGRPDGRRAALLFVPEEETAPHAFPFTSWPTTAWICPSCTAHSA